MSLMSKRQRFATLTWDDLDLWAGDHIVARGRSYYRSGHIRDLVCTPDGAVIAWVSGSERYATKVDFDGSNMVSTCTCPYWDHCKHAVAVVLEYLERLREDEEVPAIKDGDPRLAMLEDADEEVFEEEYVDVAGWSRRDVNASQEDAFRDYLQSQTKDELVELLIDLSERYPDVARKLEEGTALAAGQVDELVVAIGRDIDELTGERAWVSRWEEGSYIPDYSGVKYRLENLLANGHADGVLYLGKKLLDAGTRQMEMIDDEGETASQIRECLKIAFKALPHASLSPVAQMLWAVDVDLADGYGLCDDADIFWDQDHSPEAWSGLADELLERLGRHSSPTDPGAFSPSYRRDRLSDWAIRALKHAGRRDEIIPLCRQEAEITHSYKRLVRNLLAVDRRTEAEDWIRKGIEATQHEKPGIGGQLRSILKEMRQDEGDWLGLATLRAEEFFERPTLARFLDLQVACEQAGVWPVVRRATLRYLETGDLPEAIGVGEDGRTETGWPLPNMSAGGDFGAGQRSFPLFDTLIDIAVFEDRPEDVLSWYDRARSERAGFGWYGSRLDNIADAVADPYPDRALEIWKARAEAEIAKTNTKAYPVAGQYLRKIRGLLIEHGQEAEWRRYEMSLRNEHKRKYRFLEVLDRVGSGPIIGKF